MTTKEPSDNGLSTDEIARLRRLLDEDDIRQLATLYAQYMDHGYIDRLREIFTDDIVCEYGPYGVWEGIETVIRGLFCGHLLVPFLCFCPAPGIVPKPTHMGKCLLSLITALQCLIAVCPRGRLAAL